MSAFEALWIEKTDNGFTRNIITRNTSDLPSGDLLIEVAYSCLLYTSPSPRDTERSRMPSSA